MDSGTGAVSLISYNKFINLEKQNKTKQNKTKQNKTKQNKSCGYNGLLKKETDI